MRIENVEQLKAWDLRWPAREAGPFELNFGGIQQALGSNTSVLGVYWIGYSGGTHASFRAKYCGKAVQQPLFARLRQHVSCSHNSSIKNHLDHPKSYPRLWFRFVEFSTPAVASYAEAVMIIGFRDEYEFNRRNEWSQHWALET